MTFFFIIFKSNFKNFSIFFIVNVNILLPKLSLVTKDDDYGQTITYTEHELKKYNFKAKHISNIIDALKKNTISFGKLSVPISDILK